MTLFTDSISQTGSECESQNESTELISPDDALD